MVEAKFNFKVYLLKCGKEYDDSGGGSTGAATPTTFFWIRHCTMIYLQSIFQRKRYLMKLQRHIPHSQMIK